jgi:hypothetical protein
MGGVAERMGRVKDTHTEEEQKTAKAGCEDGKRAMMRARQDENVRHIAVWTAREGSTRLVEGGSHGGGTDADAAWRDMQRAGARRRRSKQYMNG